MLVLSNANNRLYGLTMGTPWGKRAQATADLRADITETAERIGQASAAGMTAFALVATVAIAALLVAAMALVKVRAVS